MMSCQKEINIVIAADRKYYTQALAAICSILCHHKTGGINLYLLHFDLTCKELAQFRKLKEVGDFIFHDIRIDDNFFSEWPAMRWSPSIYLRLMIPKLFPDCEKVLYLDSDILVLDDIEKLWNIDLNGKTCAACLAAVKDEHRKRLEFSKDMSYFNSGVMMFNAKKMHDDNAITKCIELFQLKQHVLKYPDQDLLNLLYHDNFLKLPLRWNLISSFCNKAPNETLYSAKETIDALKSPGIIHFTGKNKPHFFWRSSHHSYAYCYLAAAKKAKLSFLLIFFLRLKFLFGIKSKRSERGPIPLKELHACVKSAYNALS